MALDQSAPFELLEVDRGGGPHPGDAGRDLARTRPLRRRAPARLAAHDAAAHEREHAPPTPAPDTVEDVGILPGARPAFGAVSEPTPEKHIVLQILPDDLERAVDSLDPRLQTVLVLADIDGLAYAEVAELLDVPLGTVMSR